MATVRLYSALDGEDHEDQAVKAHLTSVSEQRVANIVTQQVTKALSGAGSEAPGRGAPNSELLPPRRLPAISLAQQGGGDGGGYASVAQVARLEEKIGGIEQKLTDDMAKITSMLEQLTKG